MFLYPFSLCRNNDPKKILISRLARCFGIPKTTLWKWLTGNVVGHGHHSGGRGQPCVLSVGKFTSFFPKLYCLTLKQFPISKSKTYSSLYLFPIATEDKDDLAELLIQFCRSGFPLTRKKVWNLAAHKSHIYNIAFVRLMVHNNIEVMAIPSHTLHVLQPLDSTPFVTFKTAWNSNLIEYLFTSLGCKMPIQDFWKVFWPSWRKAMTTVILQSGFRRTGMFPINPNIIKRAALGPSAAMDNIAHIEGKDMLKSWMFQIFHWLDLCLINLVF